MNNLVIVRSGGDIATGSIQKLHRAGFKVLVLEVARPLCIRRTVSLAQAMFSGYTEVEDLKATRVYNEKEIEEAFEKGQIPIIEDEKGDYIKKLKPLALVDGILAKKNLGTKRDMAPITIGLGPGFEAGVDVDLVIETNRGHDLGRLIFSGRAEADTGNPGNILGYTSERILRAPCDGQVKILYDIGSQVKKGQVLGYVDDQEIISGLEGMVRGFINEGSIVKKDMKIGDVDPRVKIENTKTISDKARAIGGGVLEGLLYLKREKNL